MKGTIKSVKCAHRKAPLHTQWADRYFTNMTHHPSYDNVLEKCFPPFARPHTLYFMFHALYALTS